MATDKDLHIHLLGICGTGMAALAGILAGLALDRPEEAART